MCLFRIRSHEQRTKTEYTTYYILQFSSLINLFIEEISDQTAYFCWNQKIKTVK